MRVTCRWPLCLFQNILGYRRNAFSISARPVTVTCVVGGATEKLARGSFSFITTSQIKDSLSLWILAASAYDFFLSWSSWALSPSHFLKNSIFIYLAAPDLVASGIFGSMTRDGTQAPCLGNLELATGPPGKPLFYFKEALYGFLLIYQVASITALVLWGHY